MRFRLAVHDTTGLHYAVRICVGTALLWFLLRWAGDINPIWAVISLIVVIEPRVPNAWLSFLSRTVNTVIGCVVGLLFLLSPGPESWVLAGAATTAVLVCTYVIRTPLSWRIAPITAVLVIASAETAPAPWGGLGVGVPQRGGPAGQCDRVAVDLAAGAGLGRRRRRGPRRKRTTRRPLLLGGSRCRAGALRFLLRMAAQAGYNHALTDSLSIPRPGGPAACWPAWSTDPLLPSSPAFCFCAPPSWRRTTAPAPTTTAEPPPPKSRRPPLQHAGGRRRPRRHAGLPQRQPLE